MPFKQNKPLFLKLLVACGRKWKKGDVICLSMRYLAEIRLFAEIRISMLRLSFHHNHYFCILDYAQVASLLMNKGPRPDRMGLLLLQAYPIIAF